MTQTNDEVEFFLSRAGPDHAIAQEVASVLETAGYRVILQDWDFGHANFVAKMDDALARSRRVITLLSRAYLSSPFCGREWQAVFSSDPRNFEQRLVLFRVDECQPAGILCTLAYTDLAPLLATPQVLQDVVLARVKLERTKRIPDVASAYQRDPRPVLHPDVGPIANFTGRSAEFNCIDEEFRTGCTQVVVNGLGGSGKSALAREYGWQRRDDYAGVWIVIAATEESIVTSFIELGRQFIGDLDQVQDRPEAARRTCDGVLPGFKRPWLLIYDDLGSEMLLRKWVAKENARILVTSRIQGFSRELRKILIEEWPRPDAVRYLQQESGRDDLEDADLEGIADDVGDLPLALAHAAAYLRENPVVRGASYRARIAEHMGRVPPGFEGQPSVFATYQAAIEGVDKRQPGAAMLMQVAGWLAPEGIPKEVFRQGAERYHEPLATLVGDELRLDETLSALARSSLIRYSTETLSFSLHRLVQITARHLDGQKTQLLTALRVLTHAFPPVEFGNWNQCARLIPHTLSVIFAIGPAEKVGFVTPVLWAGLCNSTGWYLSERGEYAAAESLYRWALTVNSAVWGRDDPRVGANLANLADLLKSTNRLADAELLYREVLTIDENRFGPDDTRVADALNNLAHLLQTANRLNEAEPLYRRALDIKEMSVGESNSNLSDVACNLAGLLYVMDRATEAEALYRRALSLCEGRLGSMDDRLATVLNNFAWLLEKHKRFSEAEPLFRRAALILIRCSVDHSNEHPHLRDAIKNLLRVSAELGCAEDKSLDRLSETGREAGLDPDQVRLLLEWWQDGSAGQDS